MAEVPPAGADYEGGAGDTEPAALLGRDANALMAAIAESIFGDGAVPGRCEEAASLPYEMRTGSAAAKRAEDMAMCLVRAVDDVARFERVPAAPGRRTPDWHVDFAGGRRAAVEVTHKQTGWSYRSFPDGRWEASSEKVVVPGDLGDFRRTVSRMMKDKHERGQLAGPEREAWLCIVLDDDAGSDLEMLLDPQPGPAVDSAQLEMALGAVMEEAECFGFHEVWCVAEPLFGPAAGPLVLRLAAVRREWAVWPQRPLFSRVPPWEPEPGISSVWPAAAPHTLPSHGGL